MKHFTRHCLLALCCVGFFLNVHCSAQGIGLFKFNGLAALDQLGNSVSGAGDVNGDGILDVVVGAYLADANGVNSGSAFVYSGADGSIIYSIDGTSVDDRFGSSVAGGGDVNNDGYADFIVGADHDDSSGSETGAVTVFSGLDGSVLHSFVGQSTSGLFGNAVAHAGDVNCDGYADIIVGAYRSSDFILDSGAVYVFSGIDGSILYQLGGGPLDRFFGRDVAGAGDVNADGVDDFVVGAEGAFVTDFAQGRVFVYSGLDGSVLHIFDGNPDDTLGRSVAGAGDVNGDGFADIIAGAPNHIENGLQAAGIVRVYSGADGAVLFSRSGSASFDNMGRDVAGVGDVDGDGFPDVIAGIPRSDVSGPNSGNVVILSGVNGLLIQDIAGDSQEDNFGGSVAGIGDVNRDGSGDLIVGAIGDDNPGSLSGAAYLIVSPTRQSLRYFSKLALSSLDLNWIPDGSNETSPTGTLRTTGGTVGGQGLFGVSLGRIDFNSGGLPLLIAIDSFNLISFGNFTFGLFGELFVPMLSRQSPSLAGTRVYIQHFEVSPVLRSSNGLGLLIVP